MLVYQRVSLPIHCQRWKKPWFHYRSPSNSGDGCTGRASASSPCPGAVVFCQIPPMDGWFLVMSQNVLHTWWLIPLSKWVITPVINGISKVNPLITGVITHLLSGMSHQVCIYIYTLPIIPSLYIYIYPISATTMCMYAYIHTIPCHIMPYHNIHTYIY